MGAFIPLQRLRDQGLQPTGGLIWLGLGLRPPKRNALAIDPDNLPNDIECRAVTGLDVLLCVNGNFTKYGVLHRLCGNLIAAHANRLQLIDLDHRRIAYLKLGGRS